MEINIFIQEVFICRRVGSSSNFLPRKIFLLAYRMRYIDTCVGLALVNITMTSIKNRSSRFNLYQRVRSSTLLPIASTQLPHLSTQDPSFTTRHKLNRQLASFCPRLAPLKRATEMVRMEGGSDGMRTRSRGVVFPKQK